MAGSLADAAVGNDVILRGEADLVLVDRSQLVHGQERAVGLVGGTAPWHAVRRGDVSAPNCALLWVVGHVQKLTRELGGGAHVNQRPVADVREHLLAVGTDDAVVALGHGVVGVSRCGDVGIHGTAFVDPLLPTSVEQAHVGMAE